MKEAIEKAATALREGGVIICPTDTVPGLSCDATNPSAIEKIYAIKGRDKNKPLLVLVNSEQMLEKYFYPFPDVAYDLLDAAERPLTLVLDTPKGIAPEAIHSDGSMGVRIVKNGPAASLINKLNKPIISTSANKSGDRTPTTIDEISKEILQGVDYVLNLPSKSVSNKPSSIIKLKKNGEVTIIRR